jgi:hypothetical protein
MGDLRKTPLGKLLLLQTLIGGGSPAVERIALGNPLTFVTDLARPLKSLLIPFTPIQQGTGDPSPQNIRPILPWNGLTVFGGGKNLFDASAVIRRDNWLIDDNGNEQPTSQSGYTQNRTAVKEGAKYTITGTIVKGSETCRLYFYNGSTFVSRTSPINANGFPYTFTVPVGCDGVAIQYNLITFDPSTIQIEAGQTATAYEEYHPITETDIVFPSPVYGGTLDVVSGVLTVEYGIYTFTGNEQFDRATNQAVDFYFFRWAYDWQGFDFDWNVGDQNVSLENYPVENNTAYWYSFGMKGNKRAGTVDSYQGIVIRDDDFTNANDFVQSLAGKKMAYKLATPQEIQLTPAQITALIGNNTIWSDADGSMTCVYLVSSKYADEHPVGGLGFGFGFGSGTPDEPDDPENPDEPEEPIIDDSENNQTEGEEP